MSALGRTARALPTLFRVGLVAALAYRSEIAVWILTTNMPLVMLALWTSVARDAPVGRYTERGFAAYFLATLVVRLLTSAWVVWQMNFEIRQGTLAQRLLRPIHPLITYAVESLSALPLRVAVAVPLTVAAVAWAGAGAFTHDVVRLAALPLAVAGAWTITFGAMALIGTLGLFWESSLAAFDLWMALYFVFAGYIFPLDLLPRGLYAVVRWLPFRYVLSFPVEVALGHASRAATWAGLGVQWAYALAFVLAALWLWRKGVARFAAYGG